MLHQKCPPLVKDIKAVLISLQAQTMLEIVIRGHEAEQLRQPTAFGSIRDQVKSL